MLDAKDFTYKAFQDNRVKSHSGFTEGQSGPLLLATHKETGEKYIVKHTFRHNAANEYAACWLGNKLAVLTPQAFLLSGNGPFSSKQAVAISFIDGLSSFDKTNLSAIQQDELIGQLTLNTLIASGDKLQLGAAGGHIYSFDFSEAFYASDETLFKMFLFNEDIAISMTGQRVGSFRNYLRGVNYDMSDIAKILGLDPEKLKTGMRTVAKRVLDITDEEIEEMSDELMQIYPVAYGIYYEECIRAIQDHVRKLEDGVEK